MSRTTLQNALTELYGLLASNTTTGTPQTSLSAAGCVKVYPYEPGASGVVKPCSVTVSPAGLEPTEWTIAVRVYVDDQNPARAQDLLVDTTVAVDLLLLAGAAYGPSRWVMEWVPEVGAWVAQTELMVGREDGF